MEPLNLKELINKKLECYFRKLLVLKKNLLVFALDLVILWYFLYFKGVTLKIMSFGKGSLLEKLPLNNSLRENQLKV